MAVNALSPDSGERAGQTEQIVRTRTVVDDEILTSDPQNLIDGAEIGEVELVTGR